MDDLFCCETYVDTTHCVPHASSTRSCPTYEKYPAIRFSRSQCDLNLYYQTSQRTYPSLTWLSNLVRVRKVHAQENIQSGESPKLCAEDQTIDSKEIQLHNPALLKEQYLEGNWRPSPEIENLALAYIHKETGMERVRMMFTPDFQGQSSPEMEVIKVATIDIFLISFVFKYVNAFKMAKQEFLREHAATVFATRLEASRRMQDNVSVTAIRHGMFFAFKVTMFTTSFLLISQIISCYRNKTSTMEYAVGAGLTGGLIRIHVGPRAMIVGTVLGTILGTIFGGFASELLKSRGLTTDQRHLVDIISKLEVQKSLSGDKEFQRKVAELTSGSDTTGFLTGENIKS